jgi:hypothetical protein
MIDGRQCDGRDLQIDWLGWSICISIGSVYPWQRKRARWDAEQRP